MFKGPKFLAGLLFLCLLAPQFSLSAPFKIGLILPLSGAEKWLGQELRDGAQLAAESSRDRPELKIIDDGGRAARLERDLLRLNDDKEIMAIIGGGSFGQTSSIEQFSHRLDIPVLVCGDPVGTSRSASEIFQLLPTNEQQFAAIFDYVTKTVPAPLGRKTVAIMTGSGHGSRIALERAASSYDVELNIINSSTGRLSMDQFRQVRRSKAKAAIVIGNNEDSLRACQEIRRASIRCPIFGRLRQASSDFRQLAAGRVSEFYVTCAAGHETYPPCEPNFAKSFLDRFGRKPSSWAALAYDGVSLIGKAVAAANKRRNRVGQNLARLPMHFGVGFVFSPQSGQLWFPSIARMDAQQFVTLRPPGKMSLRRRTQTSNKTIRRPARRVRDNKDITQSGKITKWRHFLVLPGQ